MSVNMMALVWEFPANPSEKLVMLAWADIASHEGIVTRWRDKVSQVAEKTGMTADKVHGVTASLAQEGILVESLTDFTIAIP